MKVKGTYVITDDNYELEIYYEYYWDDGDYNNPPENDMEIFITKLSLLLKPDGSVFLRFPNGSSPLGLANQHGDVTHCNIITLPKLSYWCSNSDLKVVFFRGDVLPFIFRHNFLKMPSRVLRIFLYAIIERIVRIISIQSKGVLSSNLQVILKKN